MTKCYQIYSFISKGPHTTDGFIDFPGLQSALEALFSPPFTTQIITLFFLWEISIKTPLKSACHYKQYMWNIWIAMFAFWELSVGDIITSPLCSMTLSTPAPAQTYCSPKSEHRCMFSSHLHLELTGSDTFIVSSAPATLWPASQWLLRYYTPPISPCIALFRLNRASSPGPFLP